MLYTKIIKPLKNEKVILLLIFTCTFLLRLYFLGRISNDPAFLMPVVDSLEYDSWAGDILKGNLLWDTLQNHTPLYAYFLAAVYKIFGYSVIKIVLLQYLMAALGVVLVYLIARQLINRSVALISSFFMAFYWFFIYVQSFLFGENLSFLLNILLIYLLLRLKDSLKKYFICGIIFGLSLLARPDILLFPLFILVWLSFNKIDRKNLPKIFLSFVSAILLVIAPVCLRNYLISGETVFLRTQFGANVYMGNNPDFKGTSINLEIGKDWEDFISLPDRTSGRKLKESEADKFFVRATLKIIKKEPLRWFGLISSKAFSIFTGRDFLTSEDVYFYNNYITLTPFRAVSTRLLFILALTGIILSFKIPRRFLILYLIILSEMSLIFFQIKTRYLVPIMPFVVIFSSYALYILYTDLRDKRWRRSLLTLLMILIFNAASFFNPLKIVLPDESQTYYAIAKNYDARGIYDKVMVYYLRCLKLNPRNVSAYNDLGLLFMHLKNYPAALECFKKVFSIDPHLCKTISNYKLCLELMAKNKKKK